MTFFGTRYEKMKKHLTHAVAWLVLGLAIPAARAGGIPTLEVVEVRDGRDGLVGSADSANVGTVNRARLEAHPVYRVGEVLEEAPGLILTQHSGEGKANQYFLRGFNLDHGTDLAIFVDGMPVNLRSHAHGQGWSDLNFMIPELVSSLQYKKGPYYAEEGDFAAAGAVHVRYVDALPQGVASLGGGSGGYGRLLVADSPQWGQGRLLYALELFQYDGPWTQPDDYKKVNAVLRYSQGTALNGFNLTAMAYRGTWNATDQVPKRAVDAGLIGRFDALDPTDGGEASRYSLSGAWKRTAGNSVTQANAYLVRSKLGLFSNFTYFLDDPVNGDQFMQPDSRVFWGMNASHTWLGKWNGREVENTIGLQVRNDNIFNGLFKTRQRETLSTVRQDHVTEGSLGVYFQNRTQWLEKFRTVAGVRGDFYRAKVESDNPANSGEVSASIANPQLSLVFGPWAKTEYYVNLGGGFHSNDARGATITVTPGNGPNANLPQDKAPLLVRAQGAEVGLRSAIVPGLQSSLAVFLLDVDSELVFVGDAGTTEAGRPSRRVGFEFANYYAPTSWLTVDADFAYARARFRNADPAGDRIPGAVEGVASIGLSVDHLGPYFGALRLRYFGPRALIEDNSVRSKSTTLVEARVGYRIDKNLRVALDIHNLLNSRDDQIAYFYASRLPGEPAQGVSDIHFHPVEPRSYRLTLIANF
ncbi:MAG: TonB-dependent receptor [Pseudomonadota bacterium]|jgi:outer membrane receptor protein involved in Fe transport